MPSSSSGNNNYNPPATLPSAKASVKASAKPAVSSTPVPVSVQLVQIKQDLESNIQSIPEKDKLEIEDYLKNAEKLQKEGKTEQALVLLQRAKNKLNDLKYKKADYTWQIVLVVLVILLAVAIYYVKKRMPARS